MKTRGGPGNQYQSMFNPAAQYAPKPPSLLQSKPTEEEQPTEGQSSTAGKGGIMQMLNPRAFGGQ